MPPVVTLTQISSDPQTYEDTHVHAVYDQIASHFSSTRYKPWPIISAFLTSLPTGSVGLDSGTGNGKYLPLPIDRPTGSIWTIGLDRSRNLLQIARNAGGREKGKEVVQGDVLSRCWRPGVFDFAISIATIHHLASPERRRQAVERLITSVSPHGGRILIYVWAIEQDELSKRNVPSLPSSSQDHSENQPRSQEQREQIQEQQRTAGRDVFVPWVLSKSMEKKKTTEAEDGTEKAEPQVFKRYYHMFEAGELKELVLQAAERLNLVVGVEAERGSGAWDGLEIVQDGWERSNYYVELRRWSVGGNKDSV